MLTIQVWHPDTCRCTFHLTWDDANPGDPPRFVTREEAVVLHLARQVARPASTTSDPQPEAVLCGVHAALGHTQARYDAVLADNRRGGH